MMTNKIKRKRKRKRKRKKIYFDYFVQSQLLIKLTNHMGSCFSLSIKNLLSFSLDQPSHLCHWYFDRPVHLSSASIQAALTNHWCSLSLTLSTNLITVTLTSLMLLSFFVMSYLWYGFTVWPKCHYYNFLFFFSTLSLTLYSIKTLLTPK